MKTVILYNVSIPEDTHISARYLKEARIIVGMDLGDCNTVFMTWDDRTYHEDKQTWDEKLSPSPIHRVCDFVSDIWEGSESELGYLLGHIKHMNMCDTIHFDMKNFTFDVRTQNK